MKGSGRAEKLAPCCPHKTPMIWSKAGLPGHLAQAAGQHVPVADSHQQTLPLCTTHRTLSHLHAASLFSPMPFAGLRQKLGCAGLSAE